MSPRMTELYQTEAHLLMITSPTIIIIGWIMIILVLTDGGIGSDPAILCAGLQIVEGQLGTVL